ncbi:CZB domain-containing protein [Thermomonas flagellata]|uniref:CZB domain-containing protein n=1 Tax=Thermomonas flagellata TaxID=2888524 RepID=UPI001F04E3AC|nr:CZB domain-containing protein [Thermomonas flagellata]
MGMLDVLRGWLGGGRGTAQAPQVQMLVDNVGEAHAPDEIDGLDFRKAIDAHVHWKQRLQAVIEGHSAESLDVATVARDDRCVLGQWIHGAGRVSHGHLAQFAQLREHHADFHVCAAAVLAEAQAGHVQEAQRQLGGQYARASEQVKHDLIRLYLALTKMP